MQTREREYFQTENGNESLHQDSKDNGVRLVPLATSKISSCQGHDVPAPKHS